MKYFKDSSTGAVFAFEPDGSQDALIKPSMAPMTQVEINAHLAPKQVAPTASDREAARFSAYQREADPLFFKWQRGEVEKQVWLDKVAEIKARWA